MLVTPTIIITSAICIFLCSLFMTYLTRQMALNNHILDIPNERSSHQTPTPRGGGIAIALTFTFAIWLLGITHQIAMPLVWALAVGGAAIAAIGYYDDLYTLSARKRVILHFAVALWAIYWLNGFPVLDFGTWKFSLNWKGSLLAVIGIVWTTNLYNFMDGIDGLAGSEGLFVAIISAMAVALTGNMQLAFILTLFAAAIAGFTVWNWPPAKIFLGDVGSGFLGYTFAVLAIYTANLGIFTINVWLILLAVFLCDATFTVINRAIQGKPWYAAHREHAYQRIIRNGISHKQTTLMILGINITLLLPMTFAALYWPQYAFWFMASVILGLFGMWIGITFFMPQIEDAV